MSAFTEVFNAQDLLDYSNNNEALKAFSLETLFPARKVLSNDFLTLVDTASIPQIAHVHAMDTEAEKATYDREVSTGEAFKYSRKEVFNEADIVEIQTFKNMGYAKYKPLARDIMQSGVRLINSINTALELARVQALTLGKFTQKDQNGKAVPFDYAIPKEHKLDKVNFADASFDPIEWLIKQQEAANFEVTRGLTSVKALAAMRNNKNVVERILGTSATVKSVMPGDFANFLQSQGLPALVAYRGSYDEVDAKGTHMTKKFIDDGALALFGDGTVGETVFGVTPEESRLVADSSVNQSSVGNIMLSTFSTVDPINNVVHATAVGTPTLANRNFLLQGTVL